MTDSNRAITCPHFRASPNSRRCADYIINGSCRRPDEGMCVEWLKLKHGIGIPSPPAESKQPDTGTHTAPSTPSTPGNRDLFGNPEEHPEPKPKPAASAPTAVVTPHRPNPSRAPLLGATPLVRSVTEADVASFKATQIEACLDGEPVGPIWLVPDYTSQPRIELKVEHAMVLAAVGSVFPDARVTVLRRPSIRRDEKST